MPGRPDLRGSHEYAIWPLHGWRQQQQWRRHQHHGHLQLARRFHGGRQQHGGRKLRAGARIEDGVATASDEPGATARGGDLGKFPRGTMVPEFQGAVEALAVGATSSLVETPFGFHVIVRTQ